MGCARPRSRTSRLGRGWGSSFLLFGCKLPAIYIGFSVGIFHRAHKTVLNFCMMLSMKFISAGSDCMRPRVGGTGGDWGLLSHPRTSNCVNCGDALHPSLFQATKRVQRQRQLSYGANILLVVVCSTPFCPSWLFPLWWLSRRRFRRIFL